MTPQQLFDKLSAVDKTLHNANADRFGIMWDLRNSFRHDLFFEQLVNDVLINENTNIDQVLYHHSEPGILIAALKEKFDIKE